MPVGRGCAAMRSQKASISRRRVCPRDRCMCCCVCAICVSAPPPRPALLSMLRLLQPYRAVARGTRTAATRRPVERYQATADDSAPLLWRHSLASRRASGPAIGRFRSSSSHSSPVSSTRTPASADPSQATPSGYTSLSVTASDVSLRLSRFLRLRLPPTRSLARLDQQCRKGVVRRLQEQGGRGATETDTGSRGGSTVKFDASYRVALGDQILVPASWVHSSAESETSASASPSSSSSSRKPVSEEHRKMLLDSVLYEDDDLCVVNKPAGWAVHG